MSHSSSYIFVLQGEMSFEEDCLVEGGCKSLMHNGTGYREVRQYQSDHHLVRFYFVTRIYSSYMKSILEDFRNGLKPDVLIVNSCVWDISRWVGEGVCSIVVRFSPIWTKGYALCKKTSESVPWCKMSLNVS